MDRPIGILYEHPQWFAPLFAELERRGVPYERVHGARHTFDPDERESPYSLLVNRMSPSAWTRGNARAIFHTLHYLTYLDDLGASVLNGRRAYEVELSKSRQASLFAELDIPHPRTRVIADPEQAVAAAESLAFPLLVKPNIGGSGAGIRSFASVEELSAAELDLGLDGTALVQEQLPAEGNAAAGAGDHGGRRGLRGMNLGEVGSPGIGLLPPRRPSQPLSHGRRDEDRSGAVRAAL